MNCALLAILLQTICVVNCYKILMLFSSASPSHYFLGNALARGLAEAGHDVTMISPFEEKNPPKRGKYTNIVLTGFVEQQEKRNVDFFTMENSRENFNPFVNLPMMNDMGNERANNTFKHENFKKLLKSDVEFDVIILEQFINDALKVLTCYFNAPLVMFSPLGANFWVNSLAGNPAPPSYIPDLFTSYTNDMNFWQRAVNLLISLARVLNQELIFFPKQNEIMRHYFPECPDLKDTAYNISLFLLNSHESIHQAVPLVPNTINIGGFHINAPKKLPNDLQEFIDDAEDGVVYFSMGSNLKPSKMNDQTKKAFINVLAKLKQKVLWKWDEDNFPGKPSNVRISKWFPQQDILAHPNVKLFITHGGLLSTTETIYHGVPILAIPVFGDQKMNAARAVAGEYAIALSLQDLTEESLTEALNKLLNDPKYRENAKRRSAVLHDQPVKPLDLAVYWVEFIARHKGAPHLRVAALDLTWYQYFLLDVIAFFVIVAITVLLVILKILKTVCVTRKTEKLKKK